MGSKKEAKEKKQKGFSSRSSSSSRLGLEQTAWPVDPSGSSVVGHDDDIASVLSQSSSGGDRRPGNTQVSSQRSHGTSGSKSPARRRAHPSTPTRSQSGDLVSRYGVQASATDLDSLPLGSYPPPGDSALGNAIRYSPSRSESKHPVERPSSSDTSHSDRLATKGLVQQSPVNRPVYSEPGTGQMTGTRYRDLVPGAGHTDHTG